MKGIKDGVLEIISQGQSKYVEPTGYDRIRLIWAFRNFSTLPEPVLSARQKKLIDRLSHNPEVRPHPRMVIIGAVERDFFRYQRSPQSDPRHPSSAATLQQVGTRDPAVATAASAQVVSAKAVVDRDQSPERPRFVPALHQVARIVKLAPANSVARSNDSGNLNWAISITSTWLPVAAVLVLGIASSLRLETKSHPPLAKRDLLRPPVPVVNTLPADQTGNEPAPAPAQQLPTQASSHEARNGARPDPIPSTEKRPRAVVSPASARLNPEKPLAEPAVKTPVTTSETTEPVNAQSAQRPSHLLYPNSPAAAHFPGKVLLKATVGPSGEVENVTTLDGDPAMAAAAAAAMKHWHFEPHPGTQFETEVIFDFVAPDVTTIRFLGEKQIR